MKKLVALTLILFLAFTVFAEGKTVSVTLINGCSWEVLIGFGKDINKQSLDQYEIDKLNFQVVQPNESIVIDDIPANFAAYTIAVYNEKTDMYVHNKGIYKFAYNTIVTIIYIEDEKEYDWTGYEVKGSYTN